MHQSLPFISLVPINKPSHSSLHRFAACCCLSSLPDHHRTGLVSVLGAGLGLGFHRSPEYADEGWKKKKKLLPSPPLPVVFVAHGFQKWNRHGRRICYRKKFLWGPGGNVFGLGLGFSPAPAAAWEEKKKMSSSYDRQKMQELLLQQKAFSSLSETGREEEEEQQQQQQQPWKAAKLAELDDGSRSSSSCDGGGKEEEDKEASVGRKWKTPLLQRVRKEAAAAVGNDGGFCEEEEKNRMTAEERLELFENWAATKISKEGQGAVAIIQEMRQAIAPGSQPVSSSRDLDSSAIPFESSQKSGGSSSKTQVVLTVETRADAAEQKETSNNNCQSSEEGDKGTENVPFSSLSCNKREKNNAEEKARGLQKETHPTAYSSSSGVFPQRTNPNSMVRFIETLRTNPQLLKFPKEKDPLTGLEQRPTVVKRNAKVPEDWDGPGGTVVLIDKPKGWTSFAVCSRIRHMLGIKKVGHAGTLDPMATGLLIVCVGKATKLADSYQAMTKVYSGTMRLGEYTPSCDADTEVTKTLPWEHIQDSHIMRAKQAFIGDIMQVPPMFSAIKVGGERLYKKARRGEEISVPPRPVAIYDFHLERNSDNRQDLDFVVICSKGTYVRTLCADLGQALDSYAHLTALRREKIGNLNVEDAWSVADVADHCNKLSSMQLQPTQD